MVRKVPVGQPVLPVVGGPHQPAVRVLVGRGLVMSSPAERAEAHVALFEQGASCDLGPLHAESHVCGETQRTRKAIRPRHRVVITDVAPLPADRPAGVVESRVTVEDDLDLADHAPDGTEQHMVGVVVRRWTSLGARTPVFLVPGPDQQHVPNDSPPRSAPPAGFQDHRPGQVLPRRWNGGIGRPQPEPTAIPVQDGSKDAR